MNGMLVPHMCTWLKEQLQICIIWSTSTHSLLHGDCRKNHPRVGKTGQLNPPEGYYCSSGLITCLGLCTAKGKDNTDASYNLRWVRRKALQLQNKYANNSTKQYEGTGNQFYLAPHKMDGRYVERREWEYFLWFALHPAATMAECSLIAPKACASDPIQLLD